MARCPTLVVPIVCALAVPFGCAGWRGDGDTFYAHRAPAKRARREATFSFAQPGPGWQPLRKIEGIQVAWMRPAYRALIELHAQCDEQGDSDLYQYTDHLRIDWTDWVVQEQSERRLLNRAALRTVAVGKLDGVLMKQELWVVKRAGCLFDLRYAAKPDKFAEGQAQFAAVVGGFEFAP